LEKRRFEFRDTVGAEKTPTVAKTEQGAVAELEQAGVLGAAEWVGVEQRGFWGPSHSVARAQEHELAIGIDMIIAGFAKNFAIGGAAERQEELTIGSTHNAGEGGMEAWIFVDDELFNYLRCRGGWGGAEEWGTGERESES